MACYWVEWTWASDLVGSVFEWPMALGLEILVVWVWGLAQWWVHWGHRVFVPPGLWSRIPSN